jgi:cell division protein FtsQ
VYKLKKKRISTWLYSMVGTIFQMKSFFLMFLLIALIFLLNPIYHSYKIQQVELFGCSKHTTIKSIRQQVIPTISAGTFTFRINHLQQNLMKLPWVGATTIVRDKPNTLKITVIERVPVAIVNGSYYLDNKGKMFKIDNKEKDNEKLPTITVERSDLEKAVFLLQKAKKIFAGHKYGLQHLEESPGAIWHFELENGDIIYLGNHDLPQRLAKLSEVINYLVDHEIHYHVLDMRYANGFSVRY